MSRQREWADTPLLYSSNTALSVHSMVYLFCFRSTQTLRHRLPLVDGLYGPHGRPAPGLSQPRSIPCDHKSPRNDCLNHMKNTPTYGHSLLQLHTGIRTFKNFVFVSIQVKHMPAQQYCEGVDLVGVVGVQQAPKSADKQLLPHRAETCQPVTSSW